MPILRQEEERLQQGRLGGTVGATLGVLFAVSGLSIFSLESRNQAVRALEDSMFATGSMVVLSKGIEAGANEADARVKRLLINQGCDLIDNLSSSSGREPQIEELVTCRLERAKARENLNEQTDARTAYDQAILLATRRYERTSRADAGEAMIEARQALAQYLVRQDDPPGAEAEYSRLVDDARRLGNAHAANAQFPLAEGEALEGIADLSVGRGDGVVAAESFERAADAIDRAIRSGVDRKPETVRWRAGLLRQAGEQYSNIGDFDRALDGFHRSAEALQHLETSESTPEVELEAAVALAQISDLEQRRSNGTAAGKARSEALGEIERVMSAKSASAEIREKASGLKKWLENRANTSDR
jgi:tetratricopeptide (TPR) repeat protein